LIQFPGDDQRADSTGQSFGAFFGSGGVERFSAIDAGTISVTNISATNISSGTLNADRIGADSITATHIAANAVTASEINANAVTAGKINADAVTAGKIAANAIESSNIQAGQVKAANIETGTITATQITGSTLSAIYADLGTVTAGTINGNTINVGGIGGGQINICGDGGLVFVQASTGIGVIYPDGSDIYYSVNGAHKFWSGDVIVYEKLVVPGSFEASNSNRLKLENNLDVNWNNIDGVDTIWAYHYYNACEYYEGDPFEVLDTFKPKSGKRSARVRAMGKKWKDLDHDLLHKEIYEETTHDKKIIKGYSLNKLVEIQSQAILKLKQEIENLKKELPHD